MPNTCDGCGEARPRCLCTHALPLAWQCADALSHSALRAQYCLRGRYHCGGCDDFDLCRACFDATAAASAAASDIIASAAAAAAALVPPRSAVWAHAHAREGFTLEDAPAPGEDDPPEADAPSDGGAAEEMRVQDGAAAAAEPQAEADATARALAAAFDAQQPAA
jgi:hypothetical protein